MIAYLEGKIGETWNTTCVVISRSGIGYAVAVPGHTFAELPEKGGEVALHISTVIREDAIDLFGFDTFEEKQTFEIVRGISRIGAKTALAILTSYSPEELRAIVHDGDLDALTKVSGIGKKTAQHLLLELKYKFKGEPQGAGSVQRGLSPIYGDVLAALANLGYDEDGCSHIVKKILEDDPDMDERETLRAALKILAKGKS